MGKEKTVIKDKSEKKRRRKERHSETPQEETEDDLGPAESGKKGGPPPPPSGPAPKRKPKAGKKTKKAKGGCWTPEMIEESIRELEGRLNRESEELSKSKKRRIIMRLSKLRRGLRGEVEIGGQIQKSVKTIKREMKRKSMGSSILLRKNSNVVCLCCRKKGHQMSDCRHYSPAGDGDRETGSSGEGEALKCFLCGKLGHTLKDCKEPRSDNSVLPFASCFRCGKSGHIVAFCPNNETGSIYPKGGSCNICGSVRHLARNCDQQASKACKTKNKNKRPVGTSWSGDKRTSLGPVDDPDMMWKEAME